MPHRATRPGPGRQLAGDGGLDLSLCPRAGPDTRFVQDAAEAGRCYPVVPLEFSITPRPACWMVSLRGVNAPTTQGRVELAVRGTGATWSRHTLRHRDTRRRSGSMVVPADRMIQASWPVSSKSAARTSPVSLMPRSQLASTFEPSAWASTVRDEWQEVRDPAGAGRVRNTRGGPLEPRFDREGREVELGRVAKRHVRIATAQFDPIAAAACVVMALADGAAAGPLDLPGGPTLGRRRRREPQTAGPTRHHLGRAAGLVRWGSRTARGPRWATAPPSARSRAPYWVRSTDRRSPAGCRSGRPDPMPPRGRPRAAPPRGAPPAR